MQPTVGCQSADWSSRCLWGPFVSPSSAGSSGAPHAEKSIQQGSAVRHQRLWDRSGWLGQGGL